MLDNFKNFIRKISPISDAAWEESIHRFQPLVLDKGMYFLEQGQVSKHIAFVHSGILRKYYLNEKGEEITHCFCTPNNFTSSYKSFILQAPSEVSLVALEKTELLVINHTDLHQLYASSTEWQTLGRLAAEQEYLVMEEYAGVMNNQSAKEKYLRLLDEQPEIILKAPLNYIASYLGVTRRTLSRIRKEITE